MQPRLKNLALRYFGRHKLSSVEMSAGSEDETRGRGTGRRRMDGTARQEKNYCGGESRVEAISKKGVGRRAVT